jgi:hypothetical protein
MVSGQRSSICASAGKAVAADNRGGEEAAGGHRPCGDLCVILSRSGGGGGVLVRPVEAQPCVGAGLSSQRDLANQLASTRSTGINLQPDRLARTQVNCSAQPDRRVVHSHAKVGAADLTVQRQVPASQPSRRPARLAVPPRIAVGVGRSRVVVAVDRTATGLSLWSEVNRRVWVAQPRNADLVETGFPPIEESEGMAGCRLQVVGADALDPPALRRSHSR